MAVCMDDAARWRRRRTVRIYMRVGCGRAHTGQAHRKNWEGGVSKVGVSVEERVKGC